MQEDTPLKPTKKLFYKRDPVTTPVLVLLVFFISQIAAGLLVSLYPAYKNWTSEQGVAWLEESVIAKFLYILLAEIFVVWIVLKLIKAIRVTRTMIGLIRPVSRDVVYALAGYGVYFVSFLIIAMLSANFIDSDQQQQIGFDAATGGQLGLVFVSLVILPPIAEEILFRGYLFTSFRQKYKFRTAAIITSIFFGIAHLQFGMGAPPLWIAGIDTFVLSLVLCYLREKTGGLTASILLHMLKNMVAFVVLFHAKL